MEQALRRNPSLRAWLLIAPAGLFLLIFFILPLFIVIIYGFLERGTYGGVIWQFNASNFGRVFDPLYFSTFLRSVYIAVLTTVFCILLGYPLAYFMTSRPPRQRNILLLLLMIPFWTNFLIRTYAWRVILGTDGPINSFLMWTGLVNEPLTLLFTEGAVLVGLIYGYLPFMVLPLYAAIERIDFSLMEAAADLYANGWQAFRKVLLPLSMPGVIAGCILVFIPSLGAFVTPDLLGGAKTVMIGNLIQGQFLTARDWPFGSAISMLLMVAVLGATLIYFRQGGRTL